MMDQYKDFMINSSSSAQGCDCVTRNRSAGSWLCTLYCNVSVINSTGTNTPRDLHHMDMRILNFGVNFYAFLTPIIIIVGLIGNAINLRVFLSRRMRKMSASLYLAALAISDTATLFVFVFLDWLQHGLLQWPGSPPQGINARGVTGVCQVCLYVSYVFRFLSAWIIVIFTAERYIGVCKPLQRRAMCTNSFTKRALSGVLVVAMVVSIFKPLMSSVRKAELMNGDRYICTHTKGLEYENFIMDGVYASVITAVPFLIITCLNVLIIRRLRLTRQRHLRMKFASEESTIRLEFTAILLVVSSTFIVLNFPYFIVWCYNFKQKLVTTINISNPTEGDRLRGWLYIAKTIFYGNYCINFFIYSLTGGYFRKQLVSLCEGSPPNCPSSRCKTNVTHLNGVPTRNGSTPSELGYKNSLAIPMLEVNEAADAR